MSQYSPVRLLLTLSPLLLLQPLVAADAVVLREVDEVLPTYLSGPPDPNPMFYFGRMSQRAEGRTYPYPLYDNLTNRKGEQSWHLVYLENEYVKIGIAPAMGGRLFSALDKTNNYDFIYRQHVIKPALIGLIGAWISGGVEWNIPHHHRATTFLPVQWRSEEGADGSKTVWVGELELRHRMRWAVGYTLRPGSSVLECSIRILNRTPVVHTMLCFANVAVHVNPEYQVIFPPSTQWVTFHEKSEFSQWPISHQRYRGTDFTAGVDVSWYKNHPSSNSMFAWNYREDFFAGYDHGRKAGIMSVANHHIVPGQKLWTWGNGPDGRLWDEILTDTDGPYIELMVGGYSDNQPDYSWLQPFTARSFQMNWYPFRAIGGAKNANLDAAVNLEVKDGTARFGFNTTRAFSRAIARLTVAGKTLAEEEIAIDPARPYTRQVTVPPGTDVHTVRVALSAGGRELVAYSPIRLEPEPQPVAYTPPPEPKEIANDEELFLAGQRIDQFHNPDRDADPYWEEALRRDPGSVAANTGLGLLALRRAKFDDAEKHFRKALERLTARHTTPKNAEPLYYLGVALRGQGRIGEAFNEFYKATWNEEWKAPAYFALAELATARGNFAAALELIDHSLDANALNVRAYGLKSALLRHLGRAGEVRDLLTAARRKTDPLDVRLMAEQWLVGKEQAAATTLFATLNAHPATALETAVEYANAGLWRDGAEILAGAVAAAPDKAAISPLIYYYLGDFAEKLGEVAAATRYRQQAVAASPDYVFPFQWENIAVLQRAMGANPQDARAPYYLGNLLFDWQPDAAIALWEKSAALDPSFSLTWRNLAQAYSHQPGDESFAKAIRCMEKAVSLRGATTTHFAELDRLYQATGTAVEKRLTVLERHATEVIKKDEGRAALIRMKYVSGKADEAIALLQGRTFSLWEGKADFSPGEAWADAHLVRGLQRFKARKYSEALADFEAALTPPANLRARPPAGSRRAELKYWIGCTHAALGENAPAQKAWHEVVAIQPPPQDRRRRVDPLALETLPYFHALARRKLAGSGELESTLRELVSSGTAAATRPFDSSQPTLRPPQQRLATRARLATAHYVAGLGHAGLGERQKAREEFTAALAALPDHLGTILALDQL